MKTRKKLISYLLSLALAVGLIPAFASVGGTVSYAAGEYPATMKDCYLAKYDIGYTVYSSTAKSFVVGNYGDKNLRIDKSCWSLSNTEDFDVVWNDIPAIIEPNNWVAPFRISPKPGRPGGYYETTVTFRDKDGTVVLSSIVYYRVIDENNFLSFYVSSYGYENYKDKGWVSINNSNFSTALGSSTNLYNEKIRITASPALGYEFKE